ncbi:MAG TPA: hypothetical protein VM223_14440 [Planctomycetota bacterium]|nr:hypothetical protein [Planctomycetota bacterium]
MARVLNTSASPGSTEWLARAATCPDSPLCRPISQPQCVSPSANACEKVHLLKSGEFGRFDFPDVSIIDNSIRYQTTFYQCP